MSQSTAAIGVPRPGTPSTRPAQRTSAAPPRLRVVAPSVGRSRMGLAVLCIGLLVTGLLALLMLNISIGNGAYTLTKLQKTQLQMAEQQQALAEQVEALGSPQRLADRATKLGMVPAPNTAFIRLSDGRVVGKAATATAPPKPAPTVTKAAKAPTATTGTAKGKNAKTTAKTTGKTVTKTGKARTTSTTKPTP